MHKFIQRMRFFLCAMAVGLSLGIATPNLIVADDKQEPDIYRTGVKLLKPKSDKDKRAPKPLDQAPFAMWIPPGVKTIRGAVVNPFYEKTVYQQHWRAAATQWDFAVIGGNFFGVKGEEFKPVMLNALKQLAEASQHPEIVNLPLCFVGMSAGGGMSTRLAEALPDRTIAAAPVCLEVGPRDESSRSIPMLTVFGERDGKQMEKLAAKLPAERAQQAQWATAVQWRKKHEFSRANNIIMPFFDRVIRHRYPSDASPIDGTVKLKRYNEAEGWLGDVDTWQQQIATIASFKDYKGDRGKACWFPDASLAHTWRSFVSKESPIKLLKPVGMGDGHAFKLFAANETIDVKVAVSKEWKDAQLAVYAGDQKLTAINADTLTATLTLKPGIHALHILATRKDGSRAVSPPNTIVVSK